MSKSKKGNKGQSRHKKQKDSAAIEGEDEYLNKMINSNKQRIPWYLSQNSMIVALLAGIAIVHFQKNSADLKSLFNNKGSTKESDPMSQCGLVMANSSLPDSGWGMFPLNVITEGSPVSFGDPIIQIPDIPSEQSKSIDHLLHNYLWGGDVTGGIHEGKVVYSFLPGVGSLANGHPSQWNIAPSNGAQVGEADVKRTVSPGAGAFTHYHDFSFFAYGKDIQAGEEIMVNYGSGWLSKIPHDSIVAHRPTDELRESGICLDHICPGVSSLPHAGRGAWSTRPLRKGTIVAPVPLIPIQSRDALAMVENEAQILQNYCLGHAKSSLLLVPYATGVNLVNHGGKNKSNVRFQWSSSSLHLGSDMRDRSVQELMKNPYGLLIELVAIRDIEEGEEILVDYGDEWQAAWEEHEAHWKAPREVNYTYATEYNKIMKLLRTHQELTMDPYPPNIRTTCFHEFDASARAPIVWTPKPGVQQYKNLYPCHILDRNTETNSYTVLIQSQESLLAAHEIPPNYVVEEVPRSAIKLADIIRSSDQHLHSAFRHEIRISDEMFPDTWKDLA